MRSKRTILVNLPSNPTDQASTSNIAGARLLTQFYLRTISLGTLIFVLVVGAIFYNGWQRQYAIEVNLINQRVQESAVNLKFIIKAASDEITQLSSWANNFPRNAPDSSAHLVRTAFGSGHAAANETEFSLDARATWPPEQRLGRLVLQVSSARVARRPTLNWAWPCSTASVTG